VDTDAHRRANVGAIGARILSNKMLPAGESSHGRGVSTMKSRELTALVVLMLASATAGTVYGCTQATGVGVGEHIKEFWQKTVVPLWKHGPNPDLPPPDLLKDIKPEPLPPPPNR
jgi:hypothetical protein